MAESWLDKIVKCPNCKQDVREGDRIWLDGTAYCPQCYQHFRRKYYSFQGLSRNENEGID